MKFLAFGLFLWLCGCNLAPQTAPTNEPALPVSPTEAPAPAEGVPTPADANWQALAPGLEQRLYVPEAGFTVQMMALRIDPAHFVFRAHYLPGEALTLDEWQAALPGAVAIVNANFFHADHTINGLLVTDSTVYGRCYTDRGGMFEVRNGIPRVRSLLAEPCAGELLEQAVQAFPMLVLNGAQAHTNENQRQGSRRTVIGQDAQGRIILMATPLFGLSLYDLSAYLPTTDLNLVNAFNLDGGGSTMMLIAPANYTIFSFDAVPAVVAVYAR